MLKRVPNVINKPITPLNKVVLPESMALKANFLKKLDKDNDETGKFIEKELKISNVKMLKHSYQSLVSKLQSVGC